MTNNLIKTSVVIATVALLARQGQGQQPAAQSDTKPVIAATVDRQPIYVGEVDELIARLRLGGNFERDKKARLQAELLGQLVDERLALRYLARHKQVASRHHVDAAIAELSSKLKQRKTSLQKHLSARGMTEDALRTQLLWRMSWEQYLAKRISDEVLQTHFESHRKDYDGTKVRVSHILFRVPEPSDADARDEVKQRAAAREEVRVRAAAIRTLITEGRMTFADAARSDSAAPTAKQGGEVGLISRHGEMVESFAAAAFALDEGQISQPVLTPFGIHLILCKEIQPGSKKWTDAHDQLKSALIQRGFRRIVDQERPKATITYSGAIAYFDPDTDNLVRVME